MKRFFSKLGIATLFAAGLTLANAAPALAQIALGNNGNNGVQGATVSGLNVKLGTYVPSSTANGTKTYNFNSCEVTRATSAAGALVTLRNTWVDNWVEYN